MIQLVGPYTQIPIVAKEISNNYGYFYDIIIGNIMHHIITDHTGQEYILIELQQEAMSTYSDISSSSSSSSGEPSNTFNPPSNSSVEYRSTE